MFTREEVLGGLPARRAHALLYLIEARTARLEERAVEVIGFATMGEIGAAQAGMWSFLLSQEDALGADQDGPGYLEGFRAARRPFRPPSIRQLEIQADRWAALVPANPVIRAALAHLLARKHRFTSGQVSGIRAALGLDEAPVRDAYQRLYGQPLEQIYAPTVPPGERLRWALAAAGKWVDRLPPFWFVFVFIVALGIPQAMLAMPIAVAAVGAGPGIALVLLAGCLSIVTMAGIAEAVARSGGIRYGDAYYGRLVGNYLGRVASVTLTLTALGFFLVVLMAAILGLSATLEEFTALPAAAWAALAFAAGLWALSRGVLGIPMASSILLASLVLLLFGTIMVLDLEHVRLSNLTRAAAGAAGSRLPGIEYVVGVVLMGYYAECLVVQCAKAALPRDPSGRSLVWGCVAGVAALTALLVVWVLVVAGSVPPEVMAGERSTALVPLARVAGPGVAVTGSLLVVLLPGLALLRGMIGAYGMVSEWLPAPTRRVISLRRGQDRLLLFRRSNGRRPGAGPSPATIGLTYLGREADGARFCLQIRIGDTGSGPSVSQELEIRVTRSYDSAQLFGSFPDLRRHGIRFTLEVAASDDEAANLLVALGPEVGCDGAGVLAHGESRLGASALFTARGRFLIAVAPMVALFLLVEWLLWSGQGSYVAVLGYLGILTIAYATGVIPLLLLLSCRRKGEVAAGTVLSRLGHPLLVGSLYLVYIAMLLYHGLVLWPEPAARAAALLTLGMTVGATVAMLRGGALAPRAVVELREDLSGQGSSGAFSLMANGTPMPAAVRMEYADGERECEAASGLVPDLPRLCSVTFSLPATPARELKLWTHRVLPDGRSEPLPATAEVRAGAETRSIDLGRCHGQTLLPLPPGACDVKLVLGTGFLAREPGDR
jgi:hypothetical protein